MQSARRVRRPIAINWSRFGSDFRAWRGRVKLSLRAAAQLVDVPKSTLALIEEGSQPSAVAFVAMVRMAGMRIDDYTIDPWWL